MTASISDLPDIIKEIEEVDACIADLNADGRRYRDRLVADRDALLAGIKKD